MPSSGITPAEKRAKELHDSVLNRCVNINRMPEDPWKTVAIELIQKINDAVRRVFEDGRVYKTDDPYILIQDPHELRAFVLPDPTDPVMELFSDAFSSTPIKDLDIYWEVEKRFRELVKARGLTLSAIKTAQN